MLRTLLSFFVVMLILCTLIYPFALNTVAKFIFPYQSSGSLVVKKVVRLWIKQSGRFKLLGQDFNNLIFYIQEHLYQITIQVIQMKAV